MELSESQRAVVEHAGGPLVVTGGFGAGKTTALVRRWRRLAAEHGSGHVACVVRNAAAAHDVRQRMLEAIADTGRAAVGPLVVTSFIGLALDITRRQPDSGEVNLVLGEEQRTVVAEVLASDRATPAVLSARWPTLAALTGRAAFTAEVADAVLAYQASSLEPVEVSARAAAAGVAPRWEELATFAERYRAVLAARGAFDAAGIVAHASQLLVNPEIRAAEQERYAEILVDDFETATLATDRLLGQLVGDRRAISVFGNPAAAVGANHGASPRYFEGLPEALGASTITVTRPAEPRVAERLVVCRHPSMEADAVAGELVRARADLGLRWSDLAVVTRRAGAPVRALTRALDRHGVPVASAPSPLVAEPIVEVIRARLLEPATAGLPAARAVPDIIDAIADGLIDDPAGPVDRGAERALDAVVAFATAANHWLTAHPEATAADLAQAFGRQPSDDSDPGFGAISVRAAAVDGVTVTTVDQAAGRSWPAVVVTACVEGQYPSIDGRVRFFDRLVLDGSGLPGAAVRRRASLAEERRRFELACSRGTRSAIYVAAPQPGVLVSRYVDHLPAAEPALVWPAPVATDQKARTGSARRMHPTGALQLSASQLDTYEDCPRRWFYDNHLHLSDRSTVWTGFGTLVHAILEEFLRPGSAHPFTLDYLLELGDRRWSDDVARWAPQREQARRELDQVLERWWEMEGAGFDRAQVLAVEHGFEVPVGPHRVRGFIDRIDRDSSRNGIAVVDYKTSNRMISEDDVVDDLQLAVYHLAASRDPALADIGPPVRLELLYLRHGKHREQEVTAGHEARTEARILGAADAILDEQIDPNPAADCKFCDYHRLCPLQKAGRERGAS